MTLSCIGISTMKRMIKYGLRSSEFDKFDKCETYTKKDEWKAIS